MFTQQETFDIVVRGVLGQGGQAMDDTNCRYRSDDGRKCAAGHLIPDDKYGAFLEGESVCRLAIKTDSRTGISEYSPGGTGPAGKIVKDRGHDLELTAYLQLAHDNVLQRASIDELKINFLEVAADFDLDPTIINQF